MSLTARLSAFFLGALAAVLLGFSLALYLLADSYLHGQADARLGAALDALAAVVEAEPDGLEWDPAGRHLTVGRDAGPEQVRWTITDGEGRPVDRSANLGRGALAIAEPVSSAGDEVQSVPRDGQPWRVARRVLHAPTPMTRPATLPSSPRYAALILTAGMSLEPLHATLRALAATLVGLSAAVWLMAAVLGRWLCRRALAPVARMADAARAMNAADLDRRLPDPGTADELADMHRAFDDLLDRLQEAFERQRRFTGDASHQLRTPLTAVLGQVEVALRRDRPAEEYRRVLALVAEQAGHLRGIVEALLFLARADADAALAAPEAVDLAAWLPRHLAGWADHPRAGDLRVEGTAADSLFVRAQPLLLGQLVDNLLDNAFKYSLPGTPVAVSLRREGEEIALTIRDAGPGIAPDEQAHIFEPFYRSPEARRQGHAGVGLGLAVARRIAAAFGGSLTVQSEPGRGSQFTLRLPGAARERAWEPEAPARV